ncbi:MAG: hypothetical protein IKH90_06415 [Ruminococcus sp.]|nr:hypothetical protein [Ruminococcus sp.]
MKIRTDFVTNSSSSSFVSYNLRDSEFCKFICEQLAAKGLEYSENSKSRAKSYLKLDNDRLEAEISIEGVNCDKYAPEIWEPEYVLARGLWYLDEHLKNPDDVDWEEVFEIVDFNYIHDDFYNKKIDEDYKSDMNIDRRYVVRGESEVCTADGCKLLCDIMNSHMLCDTIEKIDGGFRCYIMNEVIKKDIDYEIDRSRYGEVPVAVFDAGEGKKYIFERDAVSFYDIYPDKIYYCTNGDNQSYNGQEKEIDILLMSNRFMEIMSEFIPLDEIGEDKARKLFDSDMESDKFTCNVYMDRTD